MDIVEVPCPACGAVLKVPRAGIGKKGRCRGCGTIFPINTLLDRKNLREETIVDWLVEYADEAPPVVRPAGQRPPQPPMAEEKPFVPSTPAAAQPPSAKPAPHAAPAAQKSPGATASGVFVVTTATGQKRFQLTLDHVNNMGAFFHLDSRLLFDEDFRGVFPQRCILCGTTRALSVYLVPWPSKLPERVKQAEESAAQPKRILELDRLGNLRGVDLLRKLHRNEHLPEPYCLPMPYYVCPSCSSVGAVVTDVRTSTDGLREICTLGISSLPEAEEFVKAACGPESEAIVRIRQARNSVQSEVWQLLPLAVRNRIKLWYKEQSGELFLAYFPDAEFAKAEAGAGGLVVTDRRLLYKKALVGVEMSMTEQITLKGKAAGQSISLTLTCADAQTANILINPTCLEQLQKLLTVYNKPKPKAAVWRA
jgi:hypothetical protein